MILHLIDLQLKFLLQLLIVILLFANDIVSFDNFLLAFSQLFFHFVNLAFINRVCIGQLCALILQRLDMTLRLLK